MKKMMNLVMIVTLICGSAALMNACKKSSTPDCSQQATEQTEQAEAEDSVKQVVSTELIRTSQSWDGVELPDYFEGRPELVAVKYVFPAGKKLGWHHHVAMNYGVLVQGELTIIGQDGKTKVVHEGEPVVEMVGTIHHGENRGTKDCILYMFYLSQMAVQHPEIPLE